MQVAHVILVHTEIQKIIIATVTVEQPTLEKLVILQDTTLLLPEFYLDLLVIGLDGIMKLSEQLLLQVTY